MQRCKIRTLLGTQLQRSQPLAAINIASGHPPLDGKCKGSSRITGAKSHPAKSTRGQPGGGAEKEGWHRQHNVLPLAPPKTPRCEPSVALGSVLLPSSQWRRPTVFGPSPCCRVR